MMTIRKLREQMRMGRSIYDLPLRVTYYARVSTEKVEQQGSLENQVQYYTEFIQKNPNWTFVQGYVDEGISGTSTYKRESFLRMIDDAHRGLFDFIITKEISRFSRSTLDSIQYTQELLDANVGVLFQNDNINTLDTDSEFRLVVMAGVAQDEVRKLSERLKFGFRQSIKNGHVLGNNRLWGYDKKDCKLTIIPEQAEAVKLVFELYATGKYGIRKIAQELTRRGHTSLLGNEFNQLTIKHMLTNPKYKGWYCGNKTQTLDYRTKKKAFLEESEWVMYPDPNIPAIVSEELWDRANAIFKQRSREVRTKSTSYHNRYAYSGKIVCGIHGTSLQRQSFKTQKGVREFWRCKMYRQKGKDACSLPSVRSDEVDLVLADLFQKVVTEKAQIIRLVLNSIGETDNSVDYSAQIGRIEVQIGQIEEKKDKLLELSMADAITLSEFKVRNDRFNRQISALEEQKATLQQQEQVQKGTEINAEALEKALWEELDFTNGIHSEVVATILDHIVVLEQSNDKQIYLEVYLRLGQRASVHFQRGELVLCNSPSWNDKELHKDFAVLPSQGIVLEHAGLYPNKTGVENLLYLAQLKGVIGKREVEEAIQRVGLDPADKRVFGKYSMGMKQRLVIAQAIMEKPDVIMLDEPTNGLDEAGIKEIRQLIEQEKERGALILLASHNQEDMKILADQVYKNADGRIERKGTEL